MSSRRSVVPLAVFLLGLSVACIEPTPTLPSSPPGDAPANPPATFAALTKPGTIYVAPDSIYRQRQGYPNDLLSRFVLYDDGTFVMEFAGLRPYTGRYTRADSVVDFKWDGSNGAGPWGTNAFISGDDLTVKYNEAMLLTDFMDATYHRAHD
jgi:hypothetical protein